MAEVSRSSAEHLRPRIRSFVRREGRLTPAQSRALTTLWPRYGLSAEYPLDPDTVFPRTASVILEIGFGNGESLIQMARNYPQFNYLGIEVHRPGVGHLLLELEKAGLDHVRVYCDDAVEVLERAIADQSLARINLFFPDPWPKKRHHKRRLIQPPFIELVLRKLANGGILHLATDWPDYARHMETVLSAFPSFQPIDPRSLTPPRPQTKYERRGLQLGHTVTDLAYRKS